jgi:hypothetical protein
LAASFVMDNEGDRIPAERIPLRARHRNILADPPRALHLGLLLALACGLDAGQPLHATQDASPDDLPPTTSEVARLPVDPEATLPPAAFDVDARGLAEVLLPTPPRLVRFAADGSPEAPRLLQGAGFNGAQAGPVDLLLRPGGEALVLDTGAGTLWRVAASGEVLSRHGHFVAPISVRPGPEGRVLVTDPGSASVVVLDRKLAVEAVRRGEDLAAALTEDRGIPFLRLRMDGSGAQVGLVPLGGTSPSAERLAVLPAPAHHQVMTASVLGVAPDGIHVLTGSAASEGDGVRFDLHRVPREGALPAPVAVPRLPSGCLDCGPTYRRGQDGRLYGYLLRRDLYRVVRIEQPKEDQG